MLTGTAAAPPAVLFGEIVVILCVSPVVADAVEAHALTALQARARVGDGLSRAACRHRLLCILAHALTLAAEAPVGCDLRKRGTLRVNG